MISPEDLSQKELKGMHKAIREKHQCAKDNIVKAEANIVLGMLDEEFERRGLINSLIKIKQIYTKIKKYIQ